jgi:hypothetical protein
MHGPRNRGRIERGVVKPDARAKTASTATLYEVGLR